MVKGKQFKLSFDFVPKFDSSTVSFIFSADLGGGVSIPVPGVDKNGCNYTKCPLVKGQKAHFSYSMIVPKALPNLKAVVSVSLGGDHGLLSCIKINAGVQD